MFCSWAVGWRNSVDGHGAVGLRARLCVKQCEWTWKLLFLKKFTKQCDLCFRTLFYVFFAVPYIPFANHFLRLWAEETVWKGHGAVKLRTRLCVKQCEWTCKSFLIIHCLTFATHFLKCFFWLMVIVVGCVHTVDLCRFIIVSASGSSDGHRCGLCAYCSTNLRALVPRKHYRRI